MYAPVPMQAASGLGIPEGMMVQRWYEGYSYILLNPELLPGLVWRPLDVVGVETMEFPFGTHEALVLKAAAVESSLPRAQAVAEKAMADGQAVIMLATAANQADGGGRMVITRDVRVASRLTTGPSVIGSKALVVNEPSAGWTTGGSGNALLYVGLGIGAAALIGAAVYARKKK